VPFERWWTASPAIVAESLISVPDPLLTALRPGPSASGAAVVGSIARSLGPPEDPATAPSWLLQEQVPSFKRVLAALRRYRGALLADAVGSGKTFIALAVAAALNRGPTACLVPASLTAQWRTTAHRLGIPVTLCTHEQVSRGRLPRSTRGVVVIDESHHFRNPQTRRYRTLAPWLVGRSTLLVTATPIVNRVVDLAHQLLLAVPDDALTLEGVSSLRAMLASERPVAALGHMVLESELVNARRPPKVLKRGTPPVSDSTILGWLELLSQLRFSKSDSIAALMRGVLLRALSSSPGAFGCGLRRYRRLLLHARDAAQAGRTIDRVELRRFTRELADQLVWWEMLPSTTSQSEIDLADLDVIDTLIHRADVAGAEPDEKLNWLQNALADGAPTLVFTVFRDTAGYIRRRLSHLRLAWCTGDHAGIGNTILPRAAVLAWFREATTSSFAPSHLIVTDVAAEGLDLQRAARVVHYDMPWTPMRMEQREGRSARYGSEHSQVEVVRLELPPLLERELRLEAVLARKAGLPACAGLGEGGRQIWRWRAQLAQRFRSSLLPSGVASIPDCSPGLLAGFALWAPGQPHPLAVTVVWMEPDGSWTEAPKVIEQRLAAAAEQTEVVSTDSARLMEGLSKLTQMVRDRIAQTRGQRWAILDPSPAARRVVCRLQSLVKEAARRHQAGRLAELERALVLVAGGHSAGEAVLIEQMAEAADSQLASLLGRLPNRRSQLGGLEVRLTGLVLFGPAKADSARLPCPECPDFRPLSSISMEP
jgi:superfamily II DNA or RNA helicase